MIPTCITHMVARQQQQQLVACNIYVSSGGKKLHHKTVLLDTLFKAQERCRLICKGLITPSCDCSSLSPLLREDERHQEETGKITSSSLSKYPSENPRVAIVHAYSDGPYNRSSFHLAGDANCVADIALFMALSTLEGLLSPPSQKISSFNNHNSLTIEDNQHANNHNFLKLDDFVDNNSTHPYIGIVDHISVMPLVARVVSELSSNNTSNNNSNSSLPLPTMRIMPGFDAIFFFNSSPRANCFGEDEHKLLHLIIFHFIENKLNIILLKKTSNPTGLGFLETLQNFKSVIIQDCTHQNRKT